MGIKKNSKLICFVPMVCLIVILFVFSVNAHGEANELEENEVDYLLNPVFYISLTGIYIVAVVLFLLTLGRNLSSKYKKFFFLIIAVPVILSSLYLGGSTIYENIVSISGGPVHWHADYQVYICGERFELADPEILSNRVGSSKIHEHNDNRMHIEGTIINLKDVDLESYFRAIGGELEEGHLSYPTEKGIVNIENGENCENEEAGRLKVYVNGKRIENFEEYIIYPDPLVPPGDCIIIKFDERNEDTTDIMCDGWVVRGWNYDNFRRREVKVGDRLW